MTDHSNQSADGSGKRSFLRKWILTVGLIIGVSALMSGAICSGLNRVNDVISVGNCAANLRQLGFAAGMYAAENNGDVPSTWRSIARTQELTADVFLCPGHYVEGPAPGATREEWAPRIDEPSGKYCAYILVDGRLAEKDTKAVLAFERIGGHVGLGVNILFADGHVETLRLNADTSARLTYDHLLADFTAGIRPLRIRP